MSSYYTLDSLRAALGETRFMGLADQDHDYVIGAEDEGVVLKAIRRASSEADSYVGSKYPVPLSGSQITEAFLDKVLDIIVYRLSPDGDVMSETVRNNYKDAIAWLERVSCGKVQLGVTVDEPPPRLARALRSGPTPTFTRSGLKDLL